MPSHIKVIRSTNWTRIILAAAVIAAALFVWVAVSWQIGNMLAELTRPADPNAREIARLATEMAPKDPLAKWLAASLEKDLITPDKIANSVRMFEEVVRVSPFDFRWRIELGRAYEQADEAVKAEQAFRRAVELAPNYTYPRWQIGNFYLRQNRSDEAFAELRKATENNSTYREQVFSLAWDYFDKDPQKVEQLASDYPDVKITLAKFYAQRNRAEDSLRIWNLLSSEEKAAEPAIAKLISQILYEKRFFRQALEFSRQIGIDSEARAETVTNGGFEKLIGNADDTNFGWKIIRTDGKMDVASDSTVKQEGSRSLRVTFRNFSKPQLFNTGQVVAVEPGAKYRLSFWLRTEGLKSGGMPVLQIVNGNDDKVITSSQPFPAGSNDWQKIEIDIVVPENCEGIVLRTSRVYCGETCPLIGTFWYDDFRIVRQ